MAITVLQTAQGQPSGFNPATFSATFGSATQAGSLIVVTFTNTNDQDLGSLSDNQSNSYTQAVEIDGGGDGDGAASIYYVPNAGGGITTITARPVFGNWGLVGPAMTIFEVAGIATSSALDQTASNDDSGATSGISPGSLALAQSNELIIIVSSTGQNGNDITGADSPFDTNFNQVSASDGYSYYVTLATGLYTPNFDLDGNGTGALAVVAAFVGSSQVPQDVVAEQLAFQVKM